MHVLRSLLFYVAFFGGSVFHVLAAVVAIGVAPRWVQPICNAWSDWHHACVKTILGIRIEITGERPDHPVIYAVKHESMFEALEMPHMFRRLCGIAKQELFDIPGWGRAAKAYGLVAVARDQGASALRNMLREVRPYIAEGRPVIIFPEGTRVKRGYQPPLQSGFAAMYKLIGLPVVPVAVDSRPVYETRWKRPGTIRLHFGEPIPTGLPREEIEARVHQAINLLSGPADPAAAPEAAPAAD